jgi:hypothetical protein
MRASLGACRLLAFSRLIVGGMFLTFVRSTLPVDMMGISSFLLAFIFAVFMLRAFALGFYCRRSRRRRQGCCKIFHRSFFAL